MLKRYSEKSKEREKKGTHWQRSLKKRERKMKRGDGTSYQKQTSIFYLFPIDQSQYKLISEAKWQLFFSQTVCLHKKYKSKDIIEVFDIFTKKHINFTLIL